MKKSCIVLVGDEWVVADGYAIRAYGFSKRVGQVLGTAEELISTAKAQAVCVTQDSQDFGKAVPVLVKDDDGYIADHLAKKAGTHSVVFAVKAKQTVRTTVRVKVEAGNPPKLNVPATRTLQADDSFNAMDGVTATDVEDGNLTSRVTFTGFVDTSNGGTYRVTYTVVDSDYNEVTAVCDVKVEKKEEPVAAVHHSHSETILREVTERIIETIREVAPEPIKELLPQPEVIAPDETPQAMPVEPDPSWALLNLIASLFGLAFLFLVFRRKQMIEKVEEKQRKKAKRFAIGVFLAAAANIIFFAATEPMLTNPVVVGDRYTVWSFVILAATVALTMLTAKYATEKAEEEAPENEEMKALIDYV
ncbi:MAG: DUF5011 domain-containing protein [Clostridiales Family XIII bacterium]|nr:DUF5011 domain-containing protein [Clostridiales Family XIII bacterium]